MNNDLRRYSLSYAIKMNKKETCRVKGCDNPRYNVSYYCRYHLNRKRRTGHVEGKSIPRSHYDGMRDLAYKVIRLNRNHLLITEALHFIDTLLYRATRTGDDRLHRVAQGQQGYRPALTVHRALFHPGCVCLASPESGTEPQPALPRLRILP